MIKTILALLLVSLSAVSGQAAECLDERDKALNLNCLELRPLEVYSKNVAQVLFGGSVVTGVTSWSKIPSIVPEDKTYQFDGFIDQTTEGLYLNEADMSKYKVPYKDRKDKEKVERMAIKQNIKLESLAPTHACENGNFLLVFNDDNQVICSELVCQDQGYTELQFKCGRQ